MAKDLLGRDVQGVRIISFGYHSDVSKPFGQDYGGQSQIREHARTLIGDLRGDRVKEEEV